MSYRHKATEIDQIFILTSCGTFFSRRATSVQNSKYMLFLMSEIAGNQCKSYARESAQDQNINKQFWFRPTHRMKVLMPRALSSMVNAREIT